MSAGQLCVLRWTMRIVGGAAIAFVLLAMAYVRLGAPPVGDGVLIAKGDTEMRYLVVKASNANCQFTAAGQRARPIATEPLGRDLVDGVVFTPSHNGGVLTCQQDARVATGTMASFLRIADHDFLIGFPGALLVASAQVVRPHRGRRSGSAAQT